MTNAEKLRQMTDDELIEEIYRLQGTAVACPTCYYNKGKMMLRHYLTTETKEAKDGKEDAGSVQSL